MWPMRCEQQQAACRLQSVAMLPSHSSWHAEHYMEGAYRKSQVARGFMERAWEWSVMGWTVATAICPKLMGDEEFVQVANSLVSGLAALTPACNIWTLSGRPFIICWAKVKETTKLQKEKNLAMLWSNVFPFTASHRLLPSYVCILYLLYFP